MIYKLILVSLLATSAAFASPTKGARDELATKGERYLSSPVEYQRQRQLQQAEVSKTAARDEPLQQQEEKREYSKTAPLPEQQRELSKTQERDEQRREPSKTSAPAETEQRREEQVQLSQYPEQQKLTEEYQQQQREEAPVLTQVKEEAPAPAPTKTLRYEARPQVVVEEASSYKEAAKGQKLEFTKVEAQREEGLKASKYVEQQKAVEEPKAVAYEQQRETYYEQQQQQVELKEYDQQRRLDEQQQAQYAQVQYQQQAEERAYGVKGAAAAAQVAEPEPYAFDYSVEGSSRRESGDTNGVVRGQYTLQNQDGSRRIVDYVADQDGFRASVNTNEFGTESGSPANVELRSSQPAAQDISLRLEGKTREFLNPPAPVKGAAPLPPSKPDNWSVKGGQQQQQVAYIEEIRNTKTVVAAPAPVQQQVYYVEEARATKGAAKSEQQYEQVKAPVQPLQRAPAKGAVQRSETVESTPLEAPAPAVVKSAELRTPKAIAAEIREAAAIPVPVAPVATPVVAAPVVEPVAPIVAAPRVRVGFESATAHRPIVAAPRNQVAHAPTIQYVGGPGISRPQHRHISPAPAAIVRHYHQPGQGPVVRSQYNPRPVQPVASVLRSQLQHDRYPPNPVYNYNTRSERPLNPRVSFYSNNAETNEETPVGFGDAS